MPDQSLPDDPKTLKALLEERLRQGAARMDFLENRLVTVETAIVEQKETDRRLETLLQQIANDTEEIRAVWSAGSGAVQTAKWGGKLIVWLGGLVTAIWGVWYAITNWPRGGGL